MFVRTAGVGAALALAANAVLIPSGVALSQEHAKEHEKALDAYSNGASVPLNCYGCPFAQSEGDAMVWSNENIQNSLVYKFGYGSEHDKLTLNGVQLYPPSFTEPEPIYIHQVPSDVDSVEDFMETHSDRKALRVTGLEFAFNSAETISDEGNELLTMHLKVFGLADMALPPQVIRLFVIKDAQGRLQLAAIKKLNNPQDIKAEEEQQCKNWPLLCKWRQIFSDKLSGLKMGKPNKGCNKNRPTGERIDNRPHHRPFGKTHPNGRPHHGPHGSHGPHGQHGAYHRHHSKVHRMLHMLLRVMVNIVVPVLIGVAAGVVTYMAGMLIGMAVALVWLKVRGSGRGQYDAVPLDDEEDSADGDVKSGKQIYFDEKTAEEIVEAPPVYEEVAEKEVVN